MLTNDMKKGMRVMMSFAASMGETPRWQGTIADNKRGNLRAVTVEGWETETGDNYVFNIEWVRPTPDSDWEKVELTPKQIEWAKEVRRMGFG